MMEEMLAAGEEDGRERVILKKFSEFSEQPKMRTHPKELDDRINEV
jgi:hypothetical protein